VNFNERSKIFGCNIVYDNLFIRDDRCGFTSEYLIDSLESQIYDKF